MHLFLTLDREDTEKTLFVGPTAAVDMYYSVYNGAELTEKG